MPKVQKGAADAAARLIAKYGKAAVASAVRNFKPANDDNNLQMRINSDSNTRYSSTNLMPNSDNLAFSETEWNVQLAQDNSTATGLSLIRIPDYANTDTWKMATAMSLSNNATTATNANFYNYKLMYDQTGAITTLFFRSSSGNLTSGTVLIYGVN